MPKIGTAHASAALSHQQFTSPVGAQALFPTGAHGNLYGFLIEEPKDNLLFLQVQNAAGTIIASFSAENLIKFGRDAQPFAMKYSLNGMSVELSKSRTATSAPTDGATLHVWYKSGANNS